MSQFEVKNKYVSNVFLDQNYEPYKLLNLTVKVNYESQQNIRCDGTEIRKNMAKQFGEMMEKMFTELDNTIYPPTVNEQKFNVSLTLPHPTEEKVEDDKVGWYKI